MERKGEPPEKNHKRLRRKVTVLVPWWCFAGLLFLLCGGLSLSSVMVVPTIQGQTKFVPVDQDLENDNQILAWRRPNALKK